MEKDFDYVLNLSKGLGKLFNDRFQGFLIGKAVVKNYHEYKGGDIALKAEVTKDYSRYKLCRSCILEDEVTISEVQLVLMKKSKSLNYSAQSNSRVYGDVFCNISIKEVYEFAKNTGDFNEIHIRQNPVVQGMLIIRYLFEYLKKNNIKYSMMEIKFINPLYAEEEANIVINKEILSVYKDSILILKGRVE